MSGAWILDFSSTLSRSGRCRLWLAYDERHCSLGLKDDIGPSPRLIVSQPPFMSGADRILGKEDLARVKEKMLAISRLKIQGTAQRDHQLPGGRGMPGEGAARCRFLKRNGRRRHTAAQHVAALAWPKIDMTVL